MPFQSLHSLWRYHGEARRLVTTMKYRPSLTLAKLSGTALADALIEIPILHSSEILIPIPAARGSFRLRLFNQAAVLARAFSQRSSIPWSTDTILHRGYRAPQASLPDRERLSNVRSCFQIGRNNVTGKKVLLFDDVVTTGATIAAASRLLLQNGALEVHAAALALSDNFPAHYALLEQEFGPASRGG